MGLPNLNELISVAALLWKGKDSSTVVKELLFGGYYGSSERKGVMKFHKRLQTVNGCSLSYHLLTPPEGVLLFRWNIGTVRCAPLRFRCWLCSDPSLVLLYTWGFF